MLGGNSQWCSSWGQLRGKPDGYSWEAYQVGTAERHAMREQLRGVSGGNGWVVYVTCEHFTGMLGGNTRRHARREQLCVCYVETATEHAGWEQLRDSPCGNRWVHMRIQDFFIFNTTQHNGYIKSTTQFNKGVRNKPTILAKMKISRLTKTRCLCYLTH